MGRNEVRGDKDQWGSPGSPLSEVEGLQQQRHM